jgi:hypothetical protein
MVPAGIVASSTGAHPLCVLTKVQFERSTAEEEAL